MCVWWSGKLRRGAHKLVHTNGTLICEIVSTINKSWRLLHGDNIIHTIVIVVLKLAYCMYDELICVCTCKIKNESSLEEKLILLFINIYTCLWTEPCQTHTLHTRKLTPVTVEHTSRLINTFICNLFYKTTALYYYITEQSVRWYYGFSIAAAGRYPPEVRCYWNLIPSED